MRSKPDFQPHDVSVILPTYNEQGNIVPLIKSIEKELADHTFEIIVVDDNSPDGTPQAAREYGSPQVKVLVNSVRLGLAASIRRGIERSRGDTVIVMDSDFNHQPRYLKFMINSLQYGDCVSASRFLGARSMESRLRQFFTLVFNAFTRLMVGGSVTDYFYGYFAIRRACFDQVELESVFYGYGDYYLRLMAALEKHDLHIIEFSAVNGRRLSGVGNRDFIGVFFRYFGEVMKLSFNLRFNPHV